jgi:hypothetical protein
MKDKILKNRAEPITYLALFLAIGLLLALALTYFAYFINEDLDAYRFITEIKSENGNYKVSLFSVTVDSNGIKEIRDLHVEGSFASLDQNTYVGIYFRESGFCIIRLNKWCSPSLKLEWLTETGENQFTLIPKLGLEWTDMIKAESFASQLPPGDARLIILHKKKLTEDMFLIAIASKK